MNMHWNFPNITKLWFFINLKSHEFDHSFIVHFMLKYQSFHMDFWINHMFNDIYKMTYQYFQLKT
jgi:hypothetical protein